MSTFVEHGPLNRRPDDWGYLGGVEECVLEGFRQAGLTAPKVIITIEDHDGSCTLGSVDEARNSPVARRKAVQGTRLEAGVKGTALHVELNLCSNRLGTLAVEGLDNVTVAGLKHRIQEIAATRVSRRARLWRWIRHQGSATMIMVAIAFLMAIIAAVILTPFGLS